MRSYNQHSSLARAVELVGNRWTPLVVRELLGRPCRCADLQVGLRGIATNRVCQPDWLGGPAAS